MNSKQLIESFLKESMVLQIATAVDGIPWICSVCFAYDQDFNLYWFSRHDTRHSQEITRNPRIAGAIALPFVIGDRSRGLQFAGTAYELHYEQDLLLGLSTLKERY